MNVCVNKISDCVFKSITIFLGSPTLLFKNLAAALNRVVVSYLFFLYKIYI